MSMKSRTMVRAAAARSTGLGATSCVVFRGAKRERAVSSKYSKKFRLQMVQRLVGPHRVSASALSAEVGVPQSTLSRWLRDARTMGPMTDDTRHDDSHKPPRRRSPEERLRVVLEASELEGEELGAFLRAEGVHEAQLAQWRDAALAGVKGASKRKGRSPEAKRIRKLEAEIRRKDKALAETAALVVLQGKAEALWGEGGENTKRKSGKKRSS